jgi:enoyl-CoA hydratase/carnithine racemase
VGIIYEKKGKIAYLTINRPEAFNALDPQSVREFSDALMDFRDDDNLWVGIITGAGEKAFAAGADIKTLIPFLRGSSYPWQQPPTIMRGLELYKPIIAAVNGAALGGGLEICLACDIRIASENARFGQPEVNLGVTPGWGGTQRLPRRIPWTIACEMMFTGKPISAQEAYRIGLVSRVIPLAELMPTAETIANDILKTGPLAVRACKELMVKGTSLPLEEGLALEWTIFQETLRSEECAEGTKAFLEKRKPEFGKK